MTLHHLRSPLRLVALAGALASLTACGMFPQKNADRPTVMAVPASEAPAGDTPVAPPVAAPAPVAPAAPATPPAASTVAELQRLIQAREVTELRTTYNGSYGASLLTSETQAENTFRSFMQESASLAEVEMRRIKLQADYALSERLLNRRSEQLGTLQADQAIRQQQEQEVAQRQAETRSQAAELARQQADAKRELADLQKQIDQLEAEQRRLGGTSARGTGSKNTRQR
ncbi:MAG: DUF2968 domain-containing protein [Comamonadaceae bacterium]|nr:MAG: DUF2968 domain-containing protein [Comamonadaceae bacterium]